MVPLIKQILRNLSAEEMKPVAERALNLETPKQIQEFVKESVPFIAELI